MLRLRGNALDASKDQHQRFRRMIGDAAGRIRRPVKNPLEACFRQIEDSPLRIWSNHFDPLHRHLSRYRHGAVTALLLGPVDQGALPAWHAYFGKRAVIASVGSRDGDGCEELPDARAARRQVRELRRQYGTFDIVIDLGERDVRQQVAAFDEVWPALANGGSYIVEDSFTSYEHAWGGGWRRPGTFVEHVKDLIDSQHGWQSASVGVDRYTTSLTASHVYAGLVVLEKDEVRRPYR